jgi:hypothetical protein
MNYVMRCVLLSVNFQNMQWWTHVYNHNTYIYACLPLANTGQPSIIDSGLGGLSLENLTICGYELRYVDDDS